MVFTARSIDPINAIAVLLHTLFWLTYLAGSGEIKKIGKKIYFFPLAVGFEPLTGFGREGFVAALVGVTFAGAVLAWAVFTGAPLSEAALTGAAFVFLISTLFLLNA
jgi:hypothetical protein